MQINTSVPIFLGVGLDSITENLPSHMLFNLKAAYLQPVFWFNPHLHELTRCWLGCV